MKYLADELASFLEWYGSALLMVAVLPAQPTQDERRQAKAMAEAAMKGKLDRERLSHAFEHHGAQ